MLPYAWREEVVPGKTQIKNWTYHIIELRKAVEAVISLINAFDAVNTFDIPDVDWIPLTVGRPKAAVMVQLQELVLTL